jgi:hypothetical protein
MQRWTKEPIRVYSNEKIGEKEQGTSNSHLEDYLCYYCEYKIDLTEEYERHVAKIHHLPAYHNKAEIEKSGLEPRGKDWER